MPSRAEMRVRLEHVLRGIVIAALAVMLWQSLREKTDSGGGPVSGRGFDGALARWSVLATAPDRIHLRLDSTPSPVERAWLAALAGAGSRVTWSGDIPPVMIDAQPIAAPTGGTRVFVAAPNGSSIGASDEVGAIDTIRVQDHGASLAIASAAGSLTAYVEGSLASTIPRDSVALRKVLVIGNAGWESKFVVAALEEEGWKVDAFIRVAPGVNVTQGAAAVVDTSHYSAVVALDDAAAPYANRVIEFARMGGGVVLTPQAASVDALAPLRAGAVARPTAEGRAMQSAESISLATLSLAPIALGNDAVALERRAAAVAIAARRIDAGRTLQVGYEDTWRWRMGGAENAVRDHRLWWTGLVSSVAYAPRVPRPEVTGAVDEAPVIGLVAAIGAGTATGSVAMLSGTQSDSPAWLFALLAFALIGEVALRRLRSAS